MTINERRNRNTLFRLYCEEVQWFNGLLSFFFLLLLSFNFSLDIFVSNLFFHSYRDWQTNAHPNKWIYTYFKIQLRAVRGFNHRNCVNVVVIAFTCQLHFLWIEIYYGETEVATSAQWYAQKYNTKFVENYIEIDGFISSLHQNEKLNCKIDDLCSQVLNQMP